MEAPRRLTLAQWDAHYETLLSQGLQEPCYGGRLSRHLADGDFRLSRLVYDDAPASLRLWNFLLTEEDRLAQARSDGHKLVGAMKDLGTVPVMAYALPQVTAFYPDGAWWIPCVMELSAGLLTIADRMGVDESFCPVRAMLGAFVSGAHFPLPDLLTCNVGATCDDFSAIAQRLQGLGHPILWWETPHRRTPEPGEEAVPLPGGGVAPAVQVALVRAELERVRSALSTLAGTELSDALLAEGIHMANRIRRVLRDLRQVCFTAPVAPLPALELLIAEMLAIHFCSDREESLAVLEDLLALVQFRVQAGVGHGNADDARIYWVNPVADLSAMNLLEGCGGRLCGTEYLFSHALDAIPENVEPMEALARTALADPMVGPAQDRAARIANDMAALGAEGLVLSKIPGASHCALEGEVIRRVVQKKLDVPVLEIEVPPVSDALRPSLETRLQALVEIIKSRRS